MLPSKQNKIFIISLVYLEGSISDEKNHLCDSFFEAWVHADRFGFISRFGSFGKNNKLQAV